MDPAFITPFIASIQNVFSTMLQLQVTIKDPYIKSNPSPNFDVSGVIGLTGDVTGMTVLSMPKPAAERIIALFTGTNLSVDNADFADAVGELINMISGGAKAKFPTKKTSISCPTVIVGNSHTVAYPKDTPCIAIPCVTDCGELSLEICIKPTVPGAVAPAVAEARA